jgi:hypothetical protein
MLDGQSVVTKRVSCDVFCGRIAVRLFLCIFTPFDTTRRSDGTGRLRARRRLGYWGEQNGQSVLRVAAGYRLLQNQNRIVRVRGSIRSPATPSHNFVRQPTICCDLARRCSSRNERLWNGCFWAQSGRSAGYRRQRRAQYRTWSAAETAAGLIAGLTIPTQGALARESRVPFGTRKKRNVYLYRVTTNQADCRIHSIRLC